MIYVIGAGGHCKVVLDALLRGGVKPAELCVRDGRSGLAGGELLGIRIETPEVAPDLTGQHFHIAIGAAAIRARLHSDAEAAGAAGLTVLHPAAIISPFAQVGDAGFIAARAVVGPAARLDRGVIINHGAVVDHDCFVGEFSHVAPNSCLGGGVRVGARCLIGAGAVVLPGVSIGDNVTVGAGAVVTRDISPDQTWIGIPAAPKDR